MTSTLLLGSIGVLAETSELQRRAYNQAFADHDLGWYWNVANYCEILKMPGGKKRLTDYANGPISSDLIDSIHQRKETLFHEFLDAGITPRAGVQACLDQCRNKGVTVGLITTTTTTNIAALSHALRGHIDFSQFALITTKADVTTEKPSDEVYRHALSRLGITADDAIAVEDSEANQGAAINAGLDCYLFAGDYAVTQHNTNAVSTLASITDHLSGAAMAHPASSAAKG